MCEIYCTLSYHQLCFVLISYFLGMMLRATGNFGLFQTFSYESLRAGRYYTGGTDATTQLLVTSLSVAIPLVVCTFIARRKRWWQKALLGLGCVAAIVGYLFCVGRLLPAA